MSKKKINPVDAEFQDLLNNPNDVEVHAESNLEEQVPESIIEFEELPVAESKPEELVLPSRFLLSECAYFKRNSINPEMEISEFLIDLETILSVERVFDERLIEDFGFTEDEVIELDLMNSVILHCSAFQDEILMLDMTFDQMITIKVSYYNENGK